MNMNREILRIALPNIVSNITVSLMGIVSTAIAGHWGADSAATIGALAIGVSIFNFIYWNCSFVRMGTSGLTAQAFGAGDFRECTNMLARALSVSAVMGVLMILLQYPVGELALWAMNGSATTFTPASGPFRRASCSSGSTAGSRGCRTPYSPC